MNECPLSDEELVAIANEPQSPVQVLGDRALQARKRGLDENRCAGARWSKRKSGESATDYVGRVAERQLKRQRRAAGAGKGTHRADKAKRTRHKVLRDNWRREGNMLAVDFYAPIRAVMPRSDGDFLEEVDRDPPKEGERLREYQRRRGWLSRAAGRA